MLLRSASLENHVSSLAKPATATLATSILQLVRRRAKNAHELFPGVRALHPRALIASAKSLLRHSDGARRPVGEQRRPRFVEDWLRSIRSGRRSGVSPAAKAEQCFSEIVFHSLCLLRAYAFAYALCFKVIGPRCRSRNS